jgi:hypothetical protein
MLVAKDRKKTTFHGSNKVWEWLVMPFGLKNARVFFQQVMDQVFEGANFLKCYIDDVLVHSKGLCLVVSIRRGDYLSMSSVLIIVVCDPDDLM